MDGVKSTPELTDQEPITEPGVTPGLHAVSGKPKRAKRHRTRKICFFLTLLIPLLCWSLVQSLWYQPYTPVENSYFQSSFLKNKKVLVLVPHEDDEVNLAFGVIDAFTAAGSDVTIAFATNGDSRFDGGTRVAEAIRVDAMMGVPKDHIILLGYGDHTCNPPLFLSDPDALRPSEAGHHETYGLEGIPDYHTKRCGKAAAYTRASCEADLADLILTLRPDILFVSDTDQHVDHVSLSQMFDRVMGKLLRANPQYQPQVFKGFAYEYAWHGNPDFYRIPLASATQPWRASSYETAYAWQERVRFPLPDAYLGYTLRSSKLRTLLLTYQSQNAVVKQQNLLNGDRIYWERSTDVLWGDVTASSGNAEQLQDFVLSDTEEAPLASCWCPAAEDRQPEIHIRWSQPQTIDSLVFYDAPSPGGDIEMVRVVDDTGRAQDYTLPDGSGKPCRMALHGLRTQSLTIRLLSWKGSPVGFSEIEVLPQRKQTLQWMQPTDQDDHFLYEYACPANQPVEMRLYGYPQTPETAQITLTPENGGSLVPGATYQEGTIRLPSLHNGRYRMRVISGDCSAEVLLRVGDSMYWERFLQLFERKLGNYLPD